MLCDKCGKHEATFHKVTNVNGVVNEEHLCSHCVAKKQLEALDIFNFRDMFGNLLDNLNCENKLFCEHCLTKYKDIVDSGIVGCAKCYESFANQIEQLLGQVQKGLRHTGKLLDAKKQQSKAEKLERLQKSLKEAVEEERYEDAAKIKKEIDGLKEEK